MFGVTSTGYVLKTQAEIDAEAQTALENVVDPATGESLQADLSDPSDIVAQIVGIALEGVADGFLVDQAAYNQFDPGKATGDALSSVSLINGIVRKPASKSTVYLNFTGNPSTYGTMETGEVANGSASIFSGVTDGEFRITIDGVTQDITGINFAMPYTFSNVASQIEAAIQAVGTGGFTNATVTNTGATGGTGSTTYIIQSGTLGGNSSVSALSSVPGGTGTDISGVNYLNGQTGTIINGVESAIPAGTEVSDSNLVNLWATNTYTQFDDVGVANNVLASCTVRGAITAISGTLTELVSSVSNISTVINPSNAIVGTNEESDNALRRRRDLSTLAPSIGLVGSLDAAIKAIDGVIFNRVYNNVTNATDANGLPAKSVACVTVGGDDTQIAETIFRRTNAGVSLEGNTTVTFEDNLGETYDIKFYRPDAIVINVQVNITLIPGDAFPVDGVELIKQAIVAYSVGGAAALGITEGFDTDGFPPGENVTVSRLYTPVNSVPGHRIDSILIDDGGAPVSTFLTIGFNEVADIQEANINVTVS